MDRRKYYVVRIIQFWKGRDADLSDAPTADNADKPIKVYNRNKTKYTCRCCGLTVWGKAGLDISCNECMETLDEEEKED